MFNTSKAKLIIFSGLFISTPCLSFGEYQDIAQIDCPIQIQTLDKDNMLIAHSLNSIPEPIFQMAGKLDMLSTDCANKIWPNSKIGTYQVLLVDPTTKELWLWRPRGFNGAKDAGGLEKIDNEEIKKRPELLNPGYSFTNFRGKKTTSLMLNRNSFKTFAEAQEEVEKDKASGKIEKDFELTQELFQESKERAISQDFTLLVHEGFHAYCQGIHSQDESQQWKAAKLPKERFDNYPPESEPRYYRRMQFDALAKAVLAKEPEKSKAISEASYWQKKYEQSSDESGRTAHDDVMEGSAKYFDFMAGIFAKHGCDMDKNSLDELIKKELLKLTSMLDRQGGLPAKADLESYNIGLFANILLAQKFPHGDWQKEITKGTTPAKLLLKNINPTPAADNPTVREKIEDMQAIDVELFDPLMNALVEQNNSNDYVMLQLPLAPGSINHIGYYKNKKMGNAVIAVSASKNYSEGNNNIDLKNLSMLNIASGSACGGSNSSDYILVPKSALKTNQGITSFNFTDPKTAVNSPRFKDRIPTARGQDEFIVKKDAGGKEWYCQK